MERINESENLKLYNSIKEIFKGFKIVFNVEETPTLFVKRVFFLENIN